jgi:hypothetical protein
VRAEEVHPPSPQSQYLREEPGRQRVPLAVDAGHRDTRSARGLAPVPGAVGQEGDDPVVDGGRGVFLRDGEPVRRPLRADSRLHRGDQVQQNGLGIARRLQCVEDDGRGAVLVAPVHRRPQTFAGGAERQGVGVPAEGTAHPVYLPRVRPFTALRCAWWGAVTATVAMSS